MNSKLNIARIDQGKKNRHAALIKYSYMYLYLINARSKKKIVPTKLQSAVCILMTI